MRRWFLLTLCACSGASTEVAPEQAEAPTVAEEVVPEAPAEARQHAVVIVIDTLRADVLAKARTPNLDALAARGQVVDTAWSAGTWTVPSVISMLTGHSVRGHGWDLPSARLGKYPALPQGPRLPGVLQAQGFGTLGLYGNIYLSEDLGFDQGFDRWSRVSDRSIVRQFKKEVEASWGEGRHFAYLHLLGPHSPLRPTQEAKERNGVGESWFTEKERLDIGRAKRNQEEGVRDAYNRAYQAVVEDTDVVVGQLLDVLGDKAEQSCIIVTSDHGELLGEHGVYGHGSHLWRPLNEVPFIAAGCGTLPSQLSIAAVPHLVTSSLHVEADWPTDRSKATPLVSQREGKLAISADGQLKGLWTDDGFTVYDLSTDPDESEDIATGHAQLSALRQRWEEQVPAAPAGELVVELDDETKKGLEVLGYVEGD